MTALLEEAMPAYAPEPGPAPLRVLEAVVDALPIGLTVVSPAGVPLYANPAASRHRLAAAAGSDGFATATATVRVGGRDFVFATSTDVAAERALEDRLFRKAYFDELTGLPNAALVEHSAQALTQRQPVTSFALVMLDLDRFGAFNGARGRAAGDDLLRRVGRRLAAEMRDSDMVARAGGDKFMLLLTPVESAEALLDRCERLLQRLRDPFFVAGCEVFVSVSIGVSLCPEHACDHAALVAQADHAMQGAKRGGQGGVRLYTPELERATSERLAKEQELRAVIRDRRVCCAYQPKVDCRSGEIMGVEVLLRWIDDRSAIRPPGDILPLATSLGLIDEITPILLDETIAAIDRINAAFGETVSISFNIAAAQAGRRVFMSEIVAIIAATGFAHRFMLEVTEEAFLEKSDFHLGVLPMLREHGIGVSIDDFGTGYSSLSALSEIHADELKVDRAFITDIHRRPRSQILLKAIESLGRALGMTVIVEGVETAEELAYLMAATEIRYVQGYYFSKPMLLEEASRATTLSDRHRAASRAPGPGRQMAGRGR